MSKQDLSEFDIHGVVKNIVDLMGIAARTAPKSGGKDFVAVKAIYGEDIGKLSSEMLRYGEESGKRDFDRDGNNIDDSCAVLLIGLKNAEPVGLNCGACGFNKCSELDFR